MPTTRSNDVPETTDLVANPRQAIGEARPLFSVQGENSKQPAKQAVKGKRMTLPLEDKLVLAEVRDLLVGDADSRLERIATALEKIAGILEGGYHYVRPPDKTSKRGGGIPF